MRSVETGAASDKEKPMSAEILLAVEEAALRLKISKHTLNRWRVTGEGPPNTAPAWFGISTACSTNGPLGASAAPPASTAGNRGKRACENIQSLIYDAKVPVTVKPVEFRGSALADLRAFPDAARREAGFQLDRMQRGRDPDDWKPMQGIGAGVREIRVRAADGAFRVIYVAKFAEAVFVLHCFQKKSRKTAGEDVDLATRRYKELMKELKA
jgi:phage-related protein